MVQVDAVAAQQCPHIFKGCFLAIDVIGGGIIFGSSPRDEERAVGNDFVVVSFLNTQKILQHWTVGRSNWLKTKFINILLIFIISVSVKKACLLS